jgi:hypothetical protein
LEGFEIPIVAAVVKNTTDQVFGSGERQKFLGLFSQERDRLVYDHMLSCKETLLGHGKMEFVGRRDTDQVGSIGSEQSV